MPAPARTLRTRPGEQVNRQKPAGEGQRVYDIVSLVASVFVKGLSLEPMYSASISLGLPQHSEP